MRSNSKAKIWLLRVLLVALLLMPPTAWGQGQNAIEVISSIDKTEITVGDPITYEIKVTYQPGIEISPISFGMNLGGFEIQQVRLGDPIKQEDGNMLLRHVAKITLYEVGEFTIPPLEIIYTDQSGATRTINTLFHEVTCKSVTPSEDEGLRPEKPPFSIEPDLSGYYILGAGALGVVCLLLVCWFAIKKYKEARARRLLEEEQKPPHEVAYRKLRQLDESDLLSQGKIKEFYLQLSEIIREYLGRVYIIPALESTTQQLIASLSLSGMRDEHLKMTSRFLTDCDLVKFAKYIPQQDEIEQTFSQGMTIVDETKYLVIERLEEESEHKDSHAGDESRPKQEIPDPTVSPSVEQPKDGELEEMNK